MNAPKARKAASIGADPETRAFVASGNKLDGREARKQLIMAAIDIGSAMNNTLGGVSTDLLFYLLAPSAAEAGLGEREIDRLIAEVVFYCGESSTHRPGELPAALAGLTAPTKKERLDTQLRATWEMATP